MITKELIKDLKIEDEILVERVVTFSNKFFELFLGNNEAKIDNYLKIFLPYYITNNSPSTDVIYYHTYRHTMAVAILADDIAISRNMTISDRKILFVATAFHDIKHSFGLLNDTVNIAKAISEVIDLIENTGFGGLIPFINKIANAIRCTGFPFLIEPTNEIEYILRDCDLMMSLLPDADIFAVGLTNELKNAGIDETCTKESMNKFLKDSTLYTEEIKTKVSGLC